MCRFLLAILLTLSTCAVITHGIMVYQLSAIEYIIDEEETSENKSLVKEAKEISKETIGYLLHLHRLIAVKTLSKSLLDNSFYCSKGFYDKPYNPPETA